LSAEAAAEWDRVAGELDDAGALALVDRAALAAYCLAWAELVAATRLLDAEGRIITEPIQSTRRPPTPGPSSPGRRPPAGWCGSRASGTYGI
jgi:P27 family predicted phage terminase small subunit